jgi:pimeloyl-ACP methyl ester carboxylesterase
MAYDDSGNTDSKTIILFFHGLFSVGDATRPPPIFLERDVHFIAPTLPGWGKSSPGPVDTPYYDIVAKDITALLEHLHPGCSAAIESLEVGPTYKIYISGGSFGTVPAQMLFNAPKEKFPLGRYITACLLLAPFSPFKYHKDYTKGMSWGNYIFAGPVSQKIPFKLLQRLSSLIITRKLKTVENAEKFIRELIYDQIEEDEKLLFANWRKKRGLNEGELERGMAKNMVESVETYWDGFMGTADILHGDWGFKVEEMSGKPVMIVCSKDDQMASPNWGEWLAERYPNGRLKLLEGSHISALWTIDSTWEEVMKLG